MGKLIDIAALGSFLSRWKERYAPEPAWKRAAREQPVIVCKAVPVEPRPGFRYFFADHSAKFIVYQTRKNKPALTRDRITVKDIGRQGEAGISPIITLSNIQSRRDTALAAPTLREGNAQLADGVRFTNGGNVLCIDIWPHNTIVAGEDGTLWAATTTEAAVTSKAHMSIANKATAEDIRDGLAVPRVVYDERRAYARVDDVKRHGLAVYRMTRGRKRKKVNRVTLHFRHRRASCWRKASIGKTGVCGGRRSITHLLRVHAVKCGRKSVNPAYLKVYSRLTEDDAIVRKWASCDRLRMM